MTRFSSALAPKSKTKEMKDIAGAGKTKSEKRATAFMAQALGLQVLNLWKWIGNTEIILDQYFWCTSQRVGDIIWDGRDARRTICVAGNRAGGSIFGFF
jgi:hypothetical protein